ncbi:MAG: hypothetical protein WBE80_01735 [Methylocella sp.]
MPVSFDRSHGKGSHGRLYYSDRFTTLKDRKKETGPGLLKAMLDQLGLTKEVVTMAFGYRYTLERQENGWWLVRFPGIPEALTEGETEEEARANARDCVITALEGYMKAGKLLPREGAGHSGPDRAVLPSLVTAKLAVYETMPPAIGPRSSSPGNSACQRTPCADCSICIIVPTCGSSTRRWRR